MARKRSVEIRESLEELEQLRRYYAGTPQEVRMLFLCFLKEDPACPIIEASRKAGLSDRRGERLWGTYRKKGLQGVLQRREWGEGEEEGMRTEATAEGESGSHSLSEGSSFFTFMCEVARISEITDVKEWVASFRDILQNYLPTVDHVVVNIQHGKDLKSIRPSRRTSIYRQHVGGDRSCTTSYVVSTNFPQPFLRLLHEGKKQGFAFEKYHYPPAGFDLYIEQGEHSLSGQENFHQYLGTILLFRSIEKSPLSTPTIDFVERLRPILSYILSDFLVRQHKANEYEQVFHRIVSDFSRKYLLSHREETIVVLEIHGHSYQEVADILWLSLSTVKTHIRSAYRKLGVAGISEVFGKFFSPRWNIGRNREEKPG